MKKIIAVGLLLISNTFLFSQTWKIIEYQDILKLNFPTNYDVEDKVSVKIYSGNSSNANYQFAVAPVNFSNPSSLEDLNENYEKYLKGMSKSMTGFILSNKASADFKGFHTIRSTFHSTDSDQKLNVENLSIYIKGTIYSFTVLAPLNSNSNFDKFIDGITFNPNLTASDQLIGSSSKGINFEALGELIGTIIFLVALFFIIRYSYIKIRQKLT